MVLTTQIDKQSWRRERCVLALLVVCTHLAVGYSCWLIHFMPLGFAPPVSYVDFRIVDLPKPGQSPFRRMAAPSRSLTVRRVIRLKSHAVDKLPLSIVANPPAAIISQPADQVDLEPHLEIENLRASVRDEEHHRMRSLEEKLNESSRIKLSDGDRIARKIMKTARDGCRTAYAGKTFNLLAVIPLAIDTITDRGCRW